MLAVALLIFGLPFARSIPKVSPTVGRSTYPVTVFTVLDLYTVKKEVCIAHQIGCAKAVSQITPLQVC